MSWKDRISSAFNSAKDELGIGLAWVSAQWDSYQGWKSDYESKPSTNFISDINRTADRVLVKPMSDAFFGGLGKAAEGAAWLQSTAVARPISTAVMAGSQRDASLGDYWNRSESISPGQAIWTQALKPDAFRASGLNAQDPYAMDAASVAARREYFTNTWKGKIGSGLLDATISFGLDPLVSIGKGAKAASTSRRTLSGAEETANALRASDGAMDVSRREARLGEKINAFLERTKGMPVEQLAAQPEFKAGGDAGAIAYLFSRVDQEVTDEATNLGAKRTLWGALLGHQESIEKLRGMQSGLADELARLTQVPTQTSFVEATNGNLVNHADELARLNDLPESLEEAESRRKEITATLSRLDRLIAARGSTSLIQGDVRDRIITRQSLAPMGIREETIHTGMGGRPYRVVTGASGARLPGHVSVKDPTSGYEQLRETLSQARWMAPAERSALLADYLNAPSAGARQEVVRRAEGRVVASVGWKYGLDNAAVRKLLAAGNVRRDAYRNLLKSRYYSAAFDEDAIAIIDGEMDEAHVFARPLLQSMIEDQVPMVDPRMLDKVIKQATRNRLLDKAVRVNPIGDALVDKTDRAVDLSTDALTLITRTWKDSALMRLAYPTRVQVDSQMRLMAYMGSAAYIAQAPAAMRQMGRYLAKGVRTQDFGKGPIRKWFAPEFQQEGIETFLRKMGIPESDVAITARTLIDTDGGVADLAGELADRGLAKARASGNWGRVSEADPRWGEGWMRAVNRQIRNSPTAMRFVAGMDADAVRAQVLSDPNMRAEWDNLAPMFDDDLDAWVEAVRAHVDHYLPHADLRPLVIDRQVGQEEISKYFSQVPDRMPIHGEGHSVLERGPAAELSEWYNNLRQKWYTFASNAPENIMARAPLYAEAYKRNLAENIGRLGGDTITDVDLMAARRNADKFARREVGRILFDVSHASNMSHQARFLSPFFAAWEDMMGKWSGLLYDKPWMIERFRQAWDAPNAMGMVVDTNGNRVDADGSVWNKDENGEWYQLDPEKDALLIGKGEYIVVPLAGLTAGLIDEIGGAGSLRINKKSFNIVFQGEPFWLPGAGPLVQAPVNKLMVSSFPDLADSTLGKYILPFGVSDRSLGDQFTPSWIRQARSAFGNTRDYAEVYALLLAQETSRHNTGERGEIEPGEIAAKARNWFILRAITANASPVSAMPSAKLAFYQEQAHLYRQKYGDKDWQLKFYDDFPDYFEMSISLNTNESGIQASDRSWRALDDPWIRQKISENPEYGWALLGIDGMIDPEVVGGEYSRDVATALGVTQYGFGNTNTFRGKKTPAEALADIQRQKGWIRYQKVMTQIQRELEIRGLHSISQKGATDLREAKAVYVKKLGEENQVWLEDFNDGSSKKLPGFFAAMKDAKSDEKFAKRPDVVALDRYLEMRRQVQAALAERRTKDINHPDNADLRAAVDAFTAALAAENFGFEQMFHRLLERDDMKGDY